MDYGNNVIDNETRRLENNVIDNDNNYNKSKHVDIIADTLVEKLNAKSTSRPFMCKVAWKLSEAKIWDNVEKAMNGKNPTGLFIYLCKKDGV